MRLAWPAVSAMALRTVLLITNAIWVGRLGAPEMAAVISSMFVIWLLFSVIDIVGTGTVAVISRFYGARELDKVSHTARQAVLLAIAGSVVMTVVGVGGADFMFSVMQTGPDVVRLGKSYLQIYFAFSSVLLMNELFSAIFRATGDTKTPLTISLTATLLNIILDPLLIFGIGPFPKMGVAGAATGAAISMVVGFVLYLIVIKRGKLTFKFNWAGRFKPDFRMIGQIVRIGLPLAAAGIVFSVVYLFMNRITASFGTEAVAALGIGNRCESLSYLVCFGFFDRGSDTGGAESRRRQTGSRLPVDLVYRLDHVRNHNGHFAWLSPVSDADRFGIYQRPESQGDCRRLLDNSCAVTVIHGSRNRA